MVLLKLFYQPISPQLVYLAGQAVQNFNSRQLNMARAGSTYAIYFDEGPGYLFAGDLGRGCRGKAMLVRSCAHDKLYVRKRVLNQQNENTCDLHHDEVSNHRRFRYIPQLVDWTSYGWKSYSMTEQFCNGGTLWDLLYDPDTRFRLPVAEVFIWRVLTQLLETLEYIHHHRHPVVQGDLQPQNVFLHWREEVLLGKHEEYHHLPDFYLGDFGNSRVNWHPALAEYDQRMLHTLINALCPDITLKPGESQDYQDKSPHYSKELRECLAILPKPFNFNGDNKHPENPTPTRVLREKIMQIASRKIADLESGDRRDFRFLLPPVPGDHVGKEKSNFYGLDIDEPWYYARVDEKTGVLLDVEPKGKVKEPEHSGYGCVYE